MAKERIEVAENLKWRLSDIFESVEEWNKTYDEVSASFDFAKYEGKLSDPDTLLECLEKINAVVYKLSHLAVYAQRPGHERFRVYGAPFQSGHYVYAVHGCRCVR